MPITFHNADIKFQLVRKIELKKFIAQKVAKEAKKKLRLHCIFCSDKYLLNLNRHFLNHDFYTDILTFPINENEKEIDAEIYISIDRVKENSRKLKTDLEVELMRVIFHGILHLIGYKDKTKPQQKNMRKKENQWLKQAEGMLWL